MTQTLQMKQPLLETPQSHMWADFTPVQVKLSSTLQKKKS